MRIKSVKERRLVEETVQVEKSVTVGITVEFTPDQFEAVRKLIGKTNRSLVVDALGLTPQQDEELTQMYYDMAEFSRQMKD